MHLYIMCIVHIIQCIYTDTIWFYSRRSWDTINDLRQKVMCQSVSASFRLLLLLYVFFKTARDKPIISLYLGQFFST